MDNLGQKNINQTDYANILGYLDPFNRETQNPKIPDSKVEASIGIKVKNSVNIKTSSNTFNSNSKTYGYYVVLCAGSNQTFYVYKYEINNTQQFTVNSGIIYVGNNGTPYNFIIEEQPTGSGEFYFVDKLNNYDYYRVVSSGVTVKSGGPRSNVSGVYNVKSIPIGSHVNWNFVNNPPVSVAADKTSVLPFFKLKDEYVLADLLNRANWVKLESYRVDSQVDMEFQVCQETLSHNRPFIKTERLYRPNPGSTGTVEVQVNSSLSRSDDRDMLMMGLDHGLNVWVIDIIEPQPNTSVLLQGVTNYEMVAQPTSSLNQFMTMNDHTVGIDLAVAANVMESRLGSRTYIPGRLLTGNSGVFGGGISGTTTGAPPPVSDMTVDSVEPQTNASARALPPVPTPKLDPNTPPSQPDSQDGGYQQTQYEMKSPGGAIVPMDARMHPLLMPPILSSDKFSVNGLPPMIPGMYPFKPYPPGDGYYRVPMYDWTRHVPGPQRPDEVSSSIVPYHPPQPMDVPPPVHPPPGMFGPTRDGSRYDFGYDWTRHVPGPQRPDEVSRNTPTMIPYSELLQSDEPMHIPPPVYPPRQTTTPPSPEFERKPPPVYPPQQASPLPLPETQRKPPPVYPPSATTSRSLLSDVGDIDPIPNTETEDTIRISNKKPKQDDAMESSSLTRALSQLKDSGSYDDDFDYDEYVEELKREREGWRGSQTVSDRDPNNNKDNQMVLYRDRNNFLEDERIRHLRRLAIKKKFRFSKQYPYKRGRMLDDYYDG